MKKLNISPEYYEPSRDKAIYLAERAGRRQESVRQACSRGQQRLWSERTNLWCSVAGRAAGGFEELVLLIGVAQSEVHDFYVLFFIQK